MKKCSFVEHGPDTKMDFLLFCPKDETRNVLYSSVTRSECEKVLTKSHFYVSGEFRQYLHMPRPSVGLRSKQDSAIFDDRKNRGHIVFLFRVNPFEMAFTQHQRTYRNKNVGACARLILSLLYALNPERKYRPYATLKADEITFELF